MKWSTSTAGGPCPIALLAGSYLALLVFQFSPAALLAQGNTRLAVTINRVVGIDPMDVFPVDGASFYATVTFQQLPSGPTQVRTNLGSHSAFFGQDDIRPNWEFSTEVPGNATVGIDIEIWDDDSFSLRDGDDLLDIDPFAAPTEPGRRLTLVVDVAGCANNVANAIGGDLTGNCGTPLVSTGMQPGWRGAVFFSVDATAPPNAAGLRVRCLHDPIWPIANDPVTLTAEVLDDAATNKAAVTVDAIEIWLANRTAPALVCANANACTFALGPPAGTNFMYRCRVRQGGTTISSGWRRGQVGLPTASRAVPILFTGPRASRIDIVFIANDCVGATPPCVNYANGARDAAFIGDVRGVIRDAYYAWDVFLRHQDLINFWIALDTGDAAPYSPVTGCPHRLPANWATVYPFAEVGAIVHRDAFPQDCARAADRVFSSEPNQFATFVHETGHSPFWLADEHLDRGGYFETDTHPNIYQTLANCRRDAPALGRVAADCRRLAGINTTGAFFDSGFFTSEPAADDLMAGSGNSTPQAAGERRINFYFEQCRRASCLDLVP